MLLDDVEVRFAVVVWSDRDDSWLIGFAVDKALWDSENATTAFARGSA